MTAVARVGVIGAGTMGAGIAAHAASAGLDVVLLDIVPGGAREALERLAKARPPGAHAAVRRPADHARRGRRRHRPPGRLPWVIEAVVEDARVKNGVYDLTCVRRHPDAVDHLEHLHHPARRARLRRHHALLQPAALPAAARGGRRRDRALADAIALRRRTPRQGRRALQRRRRVHREPARRHVDRRRDRRGRRAAVSTSSSPTRRSRGPSDRPRPASSACSTWSGIDLSLDVTRSLAERLQADDPLHAVDRPPALMEALVASGRTGPQGLRRLLPARARPLEARARPRDRRRTGRRAAYRGDEPAAARLRRRRPGADAGLRRADPRRGVGRPRRRRPRDGGRLRLAGGPFAMLGRPAPPAATPRRAAPRRRQAGPRAARRNPSASLWDVGEGVVCLEFHTKMNVARRGRRPPRLRRRSRWRRRRSCCTTRASSSASARTSAACCCSSTRARGRSWTAPSGPARTPSPRSATRRSRWSAHRPGWRSAAAARSCCTATAVQAHAESYIGLPEVGVGIVPGWGGCLRAAAAPRGARAARPAGARAGGVRDDRPGAGVGLRRRGARDRLPRGPTTASR